ncbi:Helicase [Leptospira interrogans serovar Copenhageni/Icterohaemorrhagiae]|nr:Helicase [Leptospira interrogans serovar Copenhageni/Icterohaemorrhagiae]
MSNDSVLLQELDKLEQNDLKKVAALWNLTKLPYKVKIKNVAYLYEIFQNDFYLKGVLEKLTQLQVTIYSSILKNKNVLTLGEISRKVNIPPINVEMELNLLRKYHLVYQRKNRERLTNNLDKYHAFEEIAGLVPLEQNLKGDKYKISLEKYLDRKKTTEISDEWKTVVKAPKQLDGMKKFYVLASSEEGIDLNLQSLSELERDTLVRVYLSGGVSEAEDIRSYVVTSRGKYEQIVPALIAKGLVVDVCFVDEKFVRVFVIPDEILKYVQTHPILPSVKKGTKQRTEKLATNDLEFFLNTKKLISYISRKGLVLAKSGKVKQADHKRTEQELLNPDIGIFPEKSQIYQMELILPVLKLLNIVDIKGENIVLREEMNEFNGKDIFEIMKLVVHEVNEARMKRVVPAEDFTATEMPFYDKPILDKCVSLIIKAKRIHLSVNFSNIIREHLILSPGFRTKNFQSDLAELRKEIMSVIFYLHLFGLLEVEYPNRFLSLSKLGEYFFQTGELSHKTEKGGITINPDFTIIAFPDRVSIYGLHLLKAFTELKDYDRVYTFVLTKEAFQLGILLGYKPVEFIDFLKSSSKADLAQNLLFLLEDWGGNLPVVEITEDCVLVRTKDQNTMELLLGQIKGKKIVLDEIGPTAILVDKNRVQDVITVSEKLNLIVNLTR